MDKISYKVKVKVCPDCKGTGLWSKGDPNLREVCLTCYGEGSLRKDSSGKWVPNK